MATDRDSGHVFYTQGESDKTCDALKLAMGGGSAPSSAAMKASTVPYEDYINSSMPDRDATPKPTDRNA